MKNFLKRTDIVLIVGLLLLGSVGWLFISFVNQKTQGGAVKVSTAAGSYKVPIKDTLLVIPGPLGETWLRIKDKTIWVEKATCPNKICVRQGKISKAGETIICLPNKVMITIEGSKRTDAVTY